MGVEEELARLSPRKDMLITIGVFDGVHLGHKYLISQLKEQARQQDLLSGVVTFRQHPRAVISPQIRLPVLTSLEERIKLLKDEGVDEVVVLSFTRELAKLSASQFVSLLQKHLRMHGMVVGPDFALGRNREGNDDTLRKLGRDMNFSVTVVPPVKINSEVVSSTAIRNAIAAGDMKRTCSLTGRPFSLQGNVVAGAGRGKHLGFPTANLELDPEQTLPADGIYATWAYFDGKSHKSVTNIGTCPTFNGKERTVEVYAMDYDGDLYGHGVKIDIIEYLRGEKKFDNVEELKKQIAEDAKQGRAMLNSRGND